MRKLLPPYDQKESWHSFPLAQVVERRTCYQTELNGKNLPQIVWN